MAQLVLRTAGLAIALLIATNVHAQYNSTEPRLHGYEHGYREGADRGRQDRERGLGRNFRDNDYLVGSRDYDPAFGNKQTYMAGYREGYQAGYDDGYKFYDTAGRYGELYSPQSPRGRGTASAPRTSAGGYADAAFDAGYRQGIAVGQQDRQQNRRSDFRRSSIYRNGDAGQQPNGGDRNEYHATFQDGFERGYQDGYGRSRYSSDGAGYFPNRGTSGAADTRDGIGTQSRTIIVPATRQWTPTNVVVHQGDRLLFATTGEIRWTPNPNDRAQAAGSLDLKKTPGAPMPGAPAGAIIGRIDGGRPFGIGDQTAIVVPASGLLYLGVNDDTVSDNSGQFQVVLSW